MWRSTDGGKTWDKTGKCEPVGFKSVYGFFGGETWLWQARGGRVLALVRVDSNEFPPRRPAHQKQERSERSLCPTYSSDDRGRTFRRVADLGDYGEMYLSILRLQDKRLLLTFTVRDLAPPLGVRAVPGVETEDGFDFDLAATASNSTRSRASGSRAAGFGHDGAASGRDARDVLLLSRQGRPNPPGGHPLAFARRGEAEDRNAAPRLHRIPDGPARRPPRQTSRPCGRRSSGPTAPAGVRSSRS